ncbi:MAG: ABC transporter ATP-binding protein [Ilumatobacteraceae bacterium]
MADNALEIHDLQKHFGRHHVLRSVDLAVPVDSIFGFLGPNGAGKSTTLKIIMGLLRPSGGRAIVFGEDVSRHGPAARARIGFLPQHTRFHPYRTCRDVLTYVAHLYPGHRSRSELRSRVDELLELVGLGDKANRTAGMLSGGEAQRLGIAQALVSDPDLVVLDEPAASLDPQGRHDVLSILDGLRGQATVFYSTHILDDVQRVSDAVAILTDGEVVAHGPIEELLRTPTSAWSVRLNGTTDDIQGRLAAEPWVSRIRAHPRGAQQLWTVEVTDDEAARTRMLPLLVADHEIDVIEFHPSERTLEDAYLDIVGADDGT